MKRLSTGALVVLVVMGAACSRDANPVADANAADATSTSMSPDVGVSKIPTIPGVPPTTFAVIGDFGEGSIAQLDVAARMCAWRRHHPFDDVFTTGDNIYPAGRKEYFGAKFFRPYSCLFKENVQFHSALGNHDWAADNGRAELNEPRFGMPRRNYVIRKRYVRFVVWNSNRPNRRWLRRKTVARPGELWTVVLFHHPVFSPGLHGSTPGFQDLADLFARRGVDLVLNGHDHLYASVKPQDGVHYVVTGGGGATLYPCVPAYFTDVCEARNHFLYVEADVDELSVRAIPPRGAPIQSFAISRD